MISKSIEFNYTCDLCNVETAQTEGPLPLGWKSFQGIVSSPIGDIQKQYEVGPTCLGLNDVETLSTLKGLIFNE